MNKYKAEDIKSSVDRLIDQGASPDAAINAVASSYSITTEKVFLAWKYCDEIDDDDDA